MDLPIWSSIKNNKINNTNHTNHQNTKNRLITTPPIIHGKRTFINNLDNNFHILPYTYQNRQPRSDSSQKKSSN